ncbi:DNA topoisomerase 2, partial [Physocladia obscura]
MMGSDDEDFGIASASESDDFAFKAEEEQQMPKTKTKAATTKPKTTTVKPTKSTTATKEKPKKTVLPKKKLLSLDDEIDADDAMTVISSNGSNSNSKGQKKTVEEIYQKVTQIDHILLRPDTYIGSVESLQTQMWVMDDEASKKLVFRHISYVPGLFKIFDEILVNAADNKQRDKSMNTIKVVVDRENNLISVYNNGRGIPIEMHSKEGVYVPELIFGHLLTSSNYDDSEKKVTGGRNGYGAKLCNIFSSEFIVETGDSATGKKYKQRFANNMAKKEDPKITSCKTEDFTRITFKPDLAKFGMSHLDNDITALFKKRAYDLAGCLPGVKVYLNDSRINIKTFKEYIDLFNSSEEDPAKKLGSSIVYERVSDRWEIAFTVSDGQFQQVSFVNGICTSKGGTHVNHVTEQLVTALSELAKKREKGKDSSVKPHLVKSQLSIFVNCLIENAAFDSQTKENMTLKVANFGSKCTISEEFMKKGNFNCTVQAENSFFQHIVAKSGVIDNILAVAKFKSDQSLKKTDGTKRTRISGIAKLDDANNAGTKNGYNCTLILTEGDSAKSLAVSGLAVVGRDNYGVFPLRGKLLNVREAASSQILNNAEITALKQIIGLQQGKKYESTKDLRYGHIMIMTDQDHDGSHIKGLIINFLDCFWPSLLKVPGFLLEFITPIVKVTPKTKGGGRKQEISFFTIPEYEQWKRENQDGKGYTIKYYKGLGTSTTEDAKKYFSDMDLHRKSFRALEAEDTALVDMAFNKKKADDRKEWLRKFQPGTYMDHSVDEIPISDFINRELILFSMADNMRSIPSCVDGMKPGHRKILYSCFKRNLKNEIKVTQLAGYVSEHSAYHHGEASLFSTMIGMAQNFIGSNNLNLLEPRGQFGTRLQGGKDAASPRYIFTTVNPLARLIFNPEDDALLKYLNDDGQDIEPEWYIPIIPMLLVNGADGIGTGWSTSVPNYNPRHVVENLYRLMDGQDPLPMKPWYRGFKGSIEPMEKGGYKVSGTILKTSETTVEITELPIKMWTQTYKEQLESWMIGDEAKKVTPWVKDYKEYHTDTDVHFIVTLTEEVMKQAEAEGLEKRFKMTNQISTSNIVCFDLEGRICKYENVEALLKNFYTLRLKYYIKRKDAVLARLTFEWTKLDNKVRFIREIITGKLVIQNRKKSEILKDLVTRDYFRVPKVKVARTAGNADVVDGEDGEDDEEQASFGVPVASDFDYLLTMPLWNLSYEKVGEVEQLAKERDVKQDEITTLAQKTPAVLWRTDLDEFLIHWDAFEQNLNEQEASKMPRKGKGSSKIGTKKKILKKKLDSEDDDVMEFSDDEFRTSKSKAKIVETKPKSATMKAVKAEVVKVEEVKNSKFQPDLKTSLAAEAEKQLPSWMLGSSPLPSLKLRNQSFVTASKPFVISDTDNDEPKPVPVKKAKKVDKSEPKPTKKVIKKSAKLLDDDSDSENSEIPVLTKKPSPKPIESDKEDEPDEFKFEDHAPPRKKVATSSKTAEPKRRQLGAQKAVLPGKAFKPVITGKTAKLIEISDGDEKPVPVPVKSKPKQTTRKTSPEPSSPTKRARQTSNFESDEEDEVRIVSNKPPAVGVRATSRAKPVKYIVDTEDDDNQHSDEQSWSAEVETSSNFYYAKGLATVAKQKKSVEEIYQKKTQLEHILLRPDTYIGSIESLQALMWVMDDEDSNKLTFRNISYVPGLYKIFDEILVNAADNKQRDLSMDTIKVVVDREKSLISVYNNGRGIPIEMHSKEGIYVPELIFGHLLTSSNYNDLDKKLTGGRNGYGAKLCNAFSTEFIIETGDSRLGKKYEQITSAKTEDFTRITFKPDFEKFGMNSLDDDIVALFKKRAYDLAGCLPGIKVYLNNSRIKIKNFKEYIDVFSPSIEEGGESTKNSAPPIIYERVNDRWEIAVTVSDGQFQQISFVNGICTTKGGTHVNHVADQLVASLSELTKKRGGKESVIKPHLVKSQLSIFVNCLIENAVFDSQTKENMTLNLAVVSKSGVIESILAVARFKSDQALKKTDGAKRTRVSGIAKLDDANNAGTKNGSQCTLILTEGDSAKSLAVSGLSVVGRDDYGVFPLRGKMLNVREVASNQIVSNAEITALKQIIGLQQGKTYESTKDLRYGHIMIMTDQDHDGSHIKGLIINFFECFWPSLLKIPGFLLQFVTPIVRVTPKFKGDKKKEINFFTIPEYEKWKQEYEDGKGYNIKYFKGLGTSTTENAIEYFSSMDRHKKSFRPLESKDSELLDLAFNKKKADERKEWLQLFQPGTYMDHSIDKIPISDFVNKELILFSMADNMRSIPSSVDGLKPGHRKILYSCFKRNLKSEIKVTQLAGYVSEQSAYHHGEVNLELDYKLGGKDAASARYIFTALNPLARIVFNPEDDALLKYLNDDGQDIEPEWYIPILPMLLINGAEGIGTGWSTSVPNYNPRDVVKNLFRMIDGKEPEDMVPWYRGFKGSIEPADKGRYKVSGMIRKISDTSVEITELPVKVWTQSYKEQLEMWMVGDETKKIASWIKEYKEYHSDNNVHFVVTMTQDVMKQAEEEGLEKKFKLINQISTTNIVCFDLEGRIAKYDNVEILLKNFYSLRIKYYSKRKEAILARLTFEWKRIDNKMRFIQEIVSGKLIIQNRNRSEILKDLVSREYFRIPKEKLGAISGEENNRISESLEDGGDESLAVASAAGDYDYLLSMPLWNLSHEK